MTSPWKPCAEPTPEQLAAYLDGELAGADRDRVRAWLASHPDARAEVEALRQLQARYDAVAVPEPSPAAWARTLGRIEADLARARRRRSSLWAMLSGLAAAALLGVIFLHGGNGVLPALEDNEPFPVVAPEDVQIISMNPNDQQALVGVRPLLLNEIDLVTHNEIEILAGNNDGVLRIDDWGSPMVVDPHTGGGPR